MTLIIERSARPVRPVRDAPQSIHGARHSKRSPAPREHPNHAASELQARFAAVRLSFTWLGVRKTLNVQQKNQAAEPFGAEGQYLSAAKKLLDTRHPAYRTLTRLRGRIHGYWHTLSLPYPEPGLRLIPQDTIASFDQTMHALERELHEAVEELQHRYDAIKDAARQRLGSLYCEADYPPSLEGLFGVQWDFPAVEPPSYLLRLSPALYEQEKNRMTARFEEAVTLAEQAFTSELSQLVSHLVERLSPNPDGSRKVLRDSAVTNLSEFFERFGKLSIRSNPELDELVRCARQAMSGVQPVQVRDSEHLRQQIGTQLQSVQAVLDGWMMDQPRRRVLRSAAKEVTT